LFKDFRGINLKDLLARLMADQEIEVNLLEEYRRIYWLEANKNITLYPGIRPMLDRLHSRGTKLGIVTQKSRVLGIGGQTTGAQKELEMLGIDRFFTVVIGFEDVSRFKPHPEGIHLALGRLSAVPEQTLMVGDSAADIEAGRAAGCRSCRVTWGIDAEDLKSSDVPADFTLDKPEGILEIRL
jgi:HAD superfamily hydrolase (TIGR01509 family)